MAIEALSRPKVAPAEIRSVAVREVVWSAFYAEHFPAVWRNLRRLGVAEAVLDDAVQDVFLVAYRRWSEFEHRSSVRTWIYGIVVRVARDYRRSLRRHVARIERCASATTVDATDCCPAEEAERRQAIRLLREILDELPQEQRAVFVLVELEELTIQQTAEAVGLRVTTCRRRLRAARIAFQKAVERRCGSVQRRSSPCVI